MTHLKWCFFAKIVYRLKSLTILKRSSILRSITGCWICPGYFFRFTFIVDLFLLLTFLNIKGTTTLHTNVSLTTGIPQWYLSCLDVLVNFGQIFALFLVLLSLAINIDCLLRMLPYHVSSFLVSNSANDKVFFKDICLYLAMTTIFLIFIIFVIFINYLAQIESCSKSLMRSNNDISTYYFISLLTLSKFSQCFKVLIFNIETVF